MRPADSSLKACTALEHLLLLWQEIIKLATASSGKGLPVEIPEGALAFMARDNKEPTRKHRGRRIATLAPTLIFPMGS